MDDGAMGDADGPAPRRRVSGGSAVYETLKREIVELALAPGSPIDEVGLSERFGLSRTPVREALVRLAAEGLVTVLPNRGTIVSAIDFLNLSQFFDALTLMYRATTRLAAAHRRDGDLRAMRALQERFAAAVAARDALAMIATNREFHAAIARAGGNDYYTGLFLRLLDEGRRILRLYYSSFNDELPRRYVDEHERMIAAIEARNEALADELASRHADQIVRQIQSYIALDRRRTSTMPLERRDLSGGL